MRHTVPVEVAQVPRDQPAVPEKERRGGRVAEVARGGGRWVGEGDVPHCAAGARLPGVVHNPRRPPNQQLERSEALCRGIWGKPSTSLQDAMPLHPRKTARKKKKKKGRAHKAP